MLKKIHYSFILFIFSLSIILMLTIFMSQDITASISTIVPRDINNQRANIDSKMKNTQIYSEQNKMFSVKDFGALGDGKADDTSAIQAAIDAAYQAGGGVIFLPSGTYKASIKSSSLNAIHIRSNIVLKGEGNSVSIIKLADVQGNYNAILGGESPYSDLSGFSMYDLAIDGNSSNNTVMHESNFKEHGRSAVQIFAGKNINIENCKFYNQINPQTLLIAKLENAEQASVSNIVIKKNVFEAIGGGSVDYDHSTIYTFGEYVQILNNSFYSKNGSGTRGARTAIEIHGDEQVVKNNEIVGFTNGINVTGAAKSSYNQDISENIIKDAHTGITIWSYFHSGNTTNPALVNSTIANNEINLNINSWSELWGHLPSEGISLHSGSNAPIQKLIIENNKIHFDNFSNENGAINSFVSGISLSRDNSASVINEELYISHNKIENSPATGIYLSMFIKGGNIFNNELINIGQSQAFFEDNYRRSSILVDGELEDVKINNNNLLDEKNNGKSKYGIVWRGKCIDKCEVQKNNLEVKSEVKIPIFISLNNKGKTINFLK